MIQWRLFTRQIGLCLHCHYHLFLPVVPCHALHISSVMQRRRRPKLEDDTLSLPFTAPEEEEAYIKLSFEQMQRYFRVAKAVRAQTEAGKVSAGSIQEFLESNSATDDSVEGLSKMNLRSSRKRRRRQPEGNTTPKDFLDAEALFRLDRTYNATNNNSTTESYQLATTSVQDDVKDDGYTISEPTNEQKTSQENPIQEADSIIDNIERPLIPSPRSGSRKQSDEQPIREITFSLGKPRQMRRQRDEHWDASVRHRRVADSISSVIEAAIYQHHVNPLLVQANVTIYDVSAIVWLIVSTPKGMVTSDRYCSNH